MPLKHLSIVLTIKELLVYENDKLYLRFSGYITQLKVIKQKTYFSSYERVYQ